MNNKIYDKAFDTTIKIINIYLNQIENNLTKLEKSKEELKRLKKQHNISLIFLISILFCEICLFIKILSF